MSKKLFAILLSVIMVITTAFGGMTVSAEGLTNYVGDGGFENANFSGTILNFGAGGAIQTQTWGRFSSAVTRMELVTSADYGSEDSVELNGNRYMKSGVTADGQYIRGFGQILALTAGDYVLKFIAKSDAGNLFSAGIYPTTQASVGVNSAIAYTYLDATNYWKEYIVEFTVSADDIYYLVIGGNTGGDNNIRLFYMDNVAVYAKSDIVTVNAVATAGGTVTGGGVVAKGDTVTLTATAKSGYEFTGWSDGEASASRTFAAIADVSYTANFTRKLTVNLIIDGDFEAEDWTVAEAWGVVNPEDKTFTKKTEGTNTFAASTPNTRQSLATDVITVQPGETYVIEFDYKFVNSNTALTGDTNGFYRYGFIEASKTDLGGASFNPALAGNSKKDFAPGKFADDDAAFSKWQSTKNTYKNTGDTAVNVKAVIGYFNDACGYEWQVDNVKVYNESSALFTINAWAQNGTVSNGSVTALKGETVTLTATPKYDDSKFVGWFKSGSTEVISTNETLTVTATENATYYAQYAYVGKNLVINGDFESTSNKEINFASNLTSSPIENMWGRVGTGVNMFAHTDITEDDDADVNGNKYVKATVPAEGHVRSFGQYVTLEPNTDYVLEFIAKNTTKVDIYGALIERIPSGNFGVHPTGDNINIINSSAYVAVPASSDWAIYTVNFNSGDQTSVCVAFGANTSGEAGTYFAIDNVALTKATDYGIGKTIVSDFEDGVGDWTATGDATVTTVNTEDTALVDLTKYVGNKLGVLNPTAEDDTFTSPAFATEAGKTYDVIIYTRHNSADDARGSYSFTAKGENENLSAALFGESDTGEYENNKGFQVKPTVMGNTAKYKVDTFAKLILTFTATEDTHDIAITTVTPVSTFIDGFEVYCHEDSIELAQNSLGFKGTAIRTEGVQGLRFKNTINVDALKNFGNYAKVVEYGTLAIKEEHKDVESKITVEDLTNDKYKYEKSSGTFGCHLKVGVAYKAETDTDIVFASNLYNKDFTGVLIGITEENYTANYVTRAYAKVQFADGSYTYVYGEEQVANVTAVAQYIVENNLESETVCDYLNTNIFK